MKISELIEKLQEQKADNGDMEVVLYQVTWVVATGKSVEQQSSVHHVEPRLDERDNQVKMAIY